MNVGESAVYPHQAVHGIPEGGTSGGSSSSSDIARMGASGMLARASTNEVRGGMLVPRMHIPIPKNGPNPFAKGYAVVTMNLKRNDPVLFTERGREATDKEVNMLVKSGAFNFDEVMEESDAKYWYPDGLFVPLNPIYAMKHWEPPEDFHVLKCRIVAGGDQIQTAQGERVTGKDEARTMLPASMAGARGVVAYSHSVKGVTKAFDVEGAYVKSKLGGAETFGRLSKCLQPSWWAHHFIRPALPTHMAMYGIPRAGFDWDDEFSDKAIYIGMVRIEDTEGSMWVFRCDFGTAVLVMYVDDGVIGGPETVVDYLIGKFKEYYILKVQEGLSLTILGMTITTIVKEEMWLVAFRMTDYIGKMHEDYCKDIGKKSLRKYATPEWPENYDFGVLYDEKGEQQGIARKYVGRTLYVVRADRVDSFHAAIVLATEVETWNRASDVKMERLISYMNMTKDKGPTWEFHRGYMDRGGV